MPDTILLYFIGTQYKPETTLVYNVKGTLYKAPMSGNKLEIGGAIRVQPHHVKELLKKSRHYVRNRGFSDVFTPDPNLAASVADSVRKGAPVVISENMTPAQYAGMASKSDILKVAGQMLSEDDLKQLMKKYEKAEVEAGGDSPAVTAESVEVDEDGGDAENVAKPKTRGKRTQAEKEGE